MATSVNMLSNIQYATPLKVATLLRETSPLYKAYTGGSSTPPAQAAPPAPAAAAPASPTASASDLQILLASIRPAQDGEVITAEDHNALRSAMVAIANRLGLGPVSDEVTVTIVPQLREGSDGAASTVPVLPWAQDYGVAVKPTNSTAGTLVKGWMEADLPEGARIKKIVAYATMTGSGTLKVRLIRQKVTDPAVRSVLAEMTVPPAADMSKGVEADVTLPGTGSGFTAIEEFRVVNNREQKYLLTAEITDAATVTAAKIACVQIVCGQ